MKLQSRGTGSGRAGTPLDFLLALAVWFVI